jgi:hypothetical protein
LILIQIFAITCADLNGAHIRDVVRSVVGSFVTTCGEESFLISYFAIKVPAMKCQVNSPENIFTFDPENAPLAFDDFDTNFRRYRAPT